MEWQTPAVSEKFQSRFGRRPGTADSGDTGLGTSASDSTEGGDSCMHLLWLLNVLCNIILDSFSSSFLKSILNLHYPPFKMRQTGKALMS